MAEALKGVYRPRNPQATPFYQLVEDHGERLKNVYPDRYEHQFGYYRPITEKVFQHKVFRMLLKEGLITEERVRMILSWRHFSLRSMQALPGFHVHNEGRVVANDMEGRERLARYLIRPPVSLEPQ